MPITLTGVFVITLMCLAICVVVFAIEDAFALFDHWMCQRAMRKRRQQQQDD